MMELILLSVLYFAVIKKNKRNMIRLRLANIISLRDIQKIISILEKLFLIQGILMFQIKKMKNVWMMLKKKELNFMLIQR